MTIVENRKARHHYKILETIEAGIALVGSEVKSLRQKKVSLDEAYIVIQKNEAYLIQCHIQPYSQGGMHFNHEPLRKRKLLLKQREIFQLFTKINQKNLTLIPLKIYLKGSWVKVFIGIAQGKSFVDKRHDQKQKDAEKEIAYQTKHNNYK